MLYNLDEHHPSDTWLGDPPKPKGLPITYKVERRFMDEKFQIFDLQFRYLFGELPKGVYLKAAHSGDFNVDLTVQGPDTKNTLELEKTLKRRLGLDWYSLGLGNSENDEKTRILTARTGTSWLPVPIWISALASRIYKWRAILEEIQITEERIFARFESIDKNKDQAARLVFRGIPRTRFDTHTTYLAHSMDPDVLYSVSLHDWKTHVAKRPR